MTPKLPGTNTYKKLVDQVTKELSALEGFIKRRTAEGYWKIGQYIHVHLLENQSRAGYGEGFYEKLAEDVGLDITTLRRTVQFYQAYSIRAVPRELDWEHFKCLVTIENDKERQEIEERIIKNNWNTQELRDYLHTKRERVTAVSPEKPVTQLSFTRGKLHTYQIVPANDSLAKLNPLAIDLGFRLQASLPAAHSRLKKKDTAELIFEQGLLQQVEKSTAAKESLFTYQAAVDKIIDGDTLLVTFNFHLNVTISQKLRLRGVDCPEMGTEEGQKARRFVQSRLKGCDFVIVKTYKDRSDKFDRYIADVFYAPNEKDPALVAAQGVYLNQELLNECLAVGYPS